MRLTSSLLLLVPAATLALGCSSEPPAAPTPIDSGAATREDAGAGEDGDSGRPLEDGGSAEEQTCADLWRDITDVVDEHRSCTRSSDCERLLPPLIPDNGPSCGFEAALSDMGRQQIETSTEAYSMLGCGDTDATCTVAPGHPVCREGVCTLVDSFDDCTECLAAPAEPACTVGGRNAWSRCASEACFREDVASEGFCPDPASCTDVGGVCSFNERNTARCPDGFRHDLFELERGCASGHFVATCCQPYDQPCTFFGGSSFALDIDPFTCRPQRSCVSGVQDESCGYDARVYLGALSAGAEPADVRVTAMRERRVVVEGTRSTDGLRFRCEGEVGDEDGTLLPTWSCEACAGDDCQTCSATHMGLCQL